MKDTNPKKHFGDAKPGLDNVPTLPLYLLGEVMKGGAAKYGPYNWTKDPVSASTYVDAALRHLLAWRDGEDLDPESNLPHLAHVMASMAIVLDAQAGGKLVDDRRPPAKPIGEWFAEVHPHKPTTRLTPADIDRMTDEQVDQRLAELDPQWGGDTEAPMQQAEADAYRTVYPTVSKDAWCR